MKLNIVAVLLTLGLVAASSAGQARSTIDEIHMRATVQDVVLLTHFSGKVIPVDFDPRFALTVRIESVGPAATNFTVGAVVAFAIHSPSLLFGEEAKKGKTYDFSVQREIRHGKTRYFGLKVDSTLTVEQSLANQQGHAHAVVKIRGCLDRGFEMLVLRSSCDYDHLGQCVWLEDAETEYAFTKFNRLHPKHKVPVIELSFQFDRARNSRAWKKVNASLENNIRSEIVLLGQFETGSGFGHMGAYPNELLLVDVLDNKSNPTP